MSIRILLILGVLATFCVPLMAQQEEPRLSRLLDELSGVDEEAWKARRAALERRVATHRGNAAELRQRALELIQRSEREEERADAIEKELKLEGDLFQVVARLSASRPAAPMTPPVGDAVAVAKAPAPTPESMEPQRPTYDFETHVMPVFEASCTLCHEPGNAKGGLDLSTFEALMRGGGSGAVVVPGDAEGSRLYRLTARLERPFMPRGGGAIPDEDLEVLRAWIDAGAPKDAAAAKKDSAASRRDRTINTAPANVGANGGPMPVDVPARRRVEVDHPEPVTCLATSPNAPLLARPGYGQVLLHEAESGDLLAVLPFDGGRVEALDFSADGARLLAAGGRAGVEGVAVVYDVRSGELLGRMSHRGDAFLAGGLDASGATAALAGATKRLYIHDVDSGELLHRVTGHDDWILSLDFAPDGSAVASGDRKGRVLVTDVVGGTNLHVLDAHEGAVQAVAYRPDGGVIASAGDDGKLRLWDPETGERTLDARLHPGGALTMTWAGDGRMASAGRDGRVKLWGEPGRRATELGRLGDYVYAVRFDNLMTRVFAGFVDGRVRILPLGGVD